jgi:dynein heavy chain
MMVPNYALIAEIRLYSYGYVDAKRIGMKGTQALKLSSEQLSPQRHYDFGMRGLNALLVAGGNGKRKYGDDHPEDVVALRSFLDVNMPKFTSPDVPLFKGIIGDLFPGVETLKSDYGSLMAELERQCGVFGLQGTEPFKSKVIQLWETVMVRHGLMTVGIPPCGKTMVKDVLAETLAAIADGGDMYMPVTQYVMNPKSITQGQLYGEADLNTQEWTDGVLAIAVRNAAKANGDGRRQWVVLDGPVDAIWIENMNTVLDDNKKLCLNSGEIIKLSPVTTMLFEVRDLDYASPATVSRVGVVFIEPDNDLGWKPLVLSWLDTLPDYIMAEHKQQLEDLFFGSFEAFLEVAVHKCVTPVDPGANWLTMMALRLLKSLIVDKKEKFVAPNKKNADDDDGQNFPDREVMLVQLYLFACIWSTGACSNQTGRDLFNDVLKGVVEKKKDILTKYDVVSEVQEILLTAPDMAIPQLPRGQPLHDFYIDPEDGGKWKLWTERIGNQEIPKEAAFHEIIVATADTVRNQFLLRTLVESDFNVLISGPTGTAKTASINGMLLGGFPSEQYSTVSFAFSAKTSANQAQDIIDGKLDKRKKGVFGPPINKKMLIFIDDLNMPGKEEYGAQPPIEILRQAFVKTPLGRGWYDRKGWEFRNLIDMIYLTAMGPPGAGKNDITDRYSSAFNLIFVTPFDDESMARIFTTSVSKFFALMARDVAGSVPALVSATLDIYGLVSKEMLPTPAKSHYTFNLRDVSKVFQGACVCSRESLPKIDDLVRCWVHEADRVFRDRLTNRPDQTWFTNKCKSLMDKHFKRAADQVYRPHPSGTGYQELVFVDFVDPKTTAYQEVVEIEKLEKKMAECLDDFNQMSKVRMDLVLFSSFISHICRVIRVLRLPLGNALLVGVGGSGRKSTTILATFVADYSIFQIEIAKGYGLNEWHDDVRRLLMGSGMLGKIQVFLFPDTQIQDETYLEEVSSVLNTGEVPNLYGNEEKMEIMEKCSKLANAAGKFSASEVFAFYVEQCRRNTHIVLAMSPIGATFRNRLRAFPSLVNCCTIDWFMDWPADALATVANQFLATIEMEDKVRSSVVKVMVDCQLVVTDLTDKYRTEAKRHFYVTPSSYLELINSFTSMLKNQRKLVSQAKWRYDVGLEKIADAASQVAALQKDLEDLQPVLEQQAKETSEIMARVEVEKTAAEEKQTVVEEAARGANAQAAEASVIKADCEKDLEAAMPALEAAVDALSKLSKADITEVKSMKTPSPGVVMVATGMCHMFGIKPVKVAAPDGKGKVEDFWEPCKKELLNDARLLNHMIDYDKDNMTVECVTKVTPLYEDPAFDPDAIKKASLAAMGICKWIRAMVIYDKVAKEVGPKKAKLAHAEKTAEDALNMVADLKAELAEVIAKVNGLEELQTEKTNKMNELQKMKDDCSAKLVRAEKLITGLGGEKVSWTNKSKKLAIDYTNLTGDILIASGIMAYLGVFTGQYRTMATVKWVELLAKLQIPARKTFSLQDVIGDQVKIRQWVIDKLPNDALSIDNGIILDNSRRWPLMIDPQNQANKWVKTTWKDKLKSFRLSQNYARGLEMAISMGNPTLFENVKEELDAMLEPVLLKSTFKQGPVDMLKLGDSTIEWSKDFRMYITTKLANPHYAPEVCVMVALLNFMATLDGLQDQQLGILVAMEEPEVEAKRIQLVLDSAAAKAQLKEIEDRILALLSASTGNILDDQELIETLANSKTMSIKIEEQVQQQERTGVQIQEVRNIYRPLAIRCACLYFIVGELSTIDPMYQFSLDWFILQFAVAIERAESAESRDERFENLFQSYIALLYDLVCRSLFGEHKLLYSILLTFKVQEIDKELDPAAMLALLTGLPGSHPEEKPENSDWLTPVSWLRIKNLQKLGGSFDGFIDEFKSTVNDWQHVFDHENPLEIDWPKNFNMKCKPIEKALLMYALRTDQTVLAIQGIVLDKLGQAFLEIPPFDLAKSFAYAKTNVPIVFVLSMGADPMADILKLSESISHPDGSLMISKIQPISLGQGQGPKAVAAVKEGKQVGKWVLLQNCHLATSWLPTLEHMVENLPSALNENPTPGADPEEVHPFFRLWLTAMPAAEFPISTLQSGVKLTVEPPKGLRSALMRSYLALDEDWFESCTRPKEFKKLLFGLNFFHALVLDRRKFGAIGWNTKYGFSEQDNDISRRQLRQFLDEFEDIPWAALQYMVSEANYGGRVTDGQDRRAIVQILETFYTPEILEEGYAFSSSGVYYPPEHGPLSSYLHYIKNLPLNPAPEVFQMHSNASLTASINEAGSILSNAMSMISAFGGGGGDEDDDPDAKKAKPKTNEEIYSEIAGELDDKLPNPSDMLAVGRAYPVDYHQCLNTVLLMELGKMNRLVKKIKGTLKDLQKATKGLVVFSPELEEVAMGVLANKTPNAWMGASYPCLKPMQSYVSDHIERWVFYKDWVSNGAPNVFWFSAYFFQQAFLTGVMQNFARKEQIAIDRCVWNYGVCKAADSHPAEPPDVGAYTNGLFMDGARWDDEAGYIVDSFPKVLWASVPNIHLIPVELGNDRQTERAKFNSGHRDHVYPNPVYKESLRKGVLSTSGHSSNFILWLYMPISSDTTEQTWTRRGTALITMTDD